MDGISCFFHSNRTNSEIIIVPFSLPSHDFNVRLSIYSCLFFSMMPIPILIRLIKEHLRSTFSPFLVPYLILPASKDWTTEEASFVEYSSRCESSVFITVVVVIFRSFKRLAQCSLDPSHFIIKINFHFLCSFSRLVSMSLAHCTGGVRGTLSYGGMRLGHGVRREVHMKTNVDSAALQTSPNASLPKSSNNNGRISSFNLLILKKGWKHFSSFCLFFLSSCVFKNICFLFAVVTFFLFFKFILYTFRCALHLAWSHRLSPHIEISLLLLLYFVCVSLFWGRISAAATECTMGIYSIFGSLTLGWHMKHSNDQNHLFDLSLFSVIPQFERSTFSVFVLCLLFSLCVVDFSQFSHYMFKLQTSLWANGRARERRKFFRQTTNKKIFSFSPLHPLCFAMPLPNFRTIWCRRLEMAVSLNCNVC